MHCTRRAATPAPRRLRDVERSRSIEPFQAAAFPAFRRDGRGVDLMANRRCSTRSLARAGSSCSPCWPSCSRPAAGTRSGRPTTRRSGRSTSRCSGRSRSGLASTSNSPRWSKEIERRTPFKVVGKDEGADTILEGLVTFTDKNATVVNPNNLPRQILGGMTVRGPMGRHPHGCDPRRSVEAPEVSVTENVPFFPELGETAELGAYQGIPAAGSRHRQHDGRALVGPGTATRRRSTAR